MTVSDLATRFQNVFCSDIGQDEGISIHKHSIVYINLIYNFKLWFHFWKLKFSRLFTFTAIKWLDWYDFSCSTINYKHNLMILKCTDLAINIYRLRSSICFTHIHNNWRINLKFKRKSRSIMMHVHAVVYTSGRWDGILE